MSIFTLWMLLQAPKVGQVFTLIGVMGAVIGLGLSGFSLLARAEGDADSADQLRKYGRTCLVIGIPCGLVAALLPSAETMRWLVGYYVVSGVDGAAELPADVVEWARAWLDASTRDLLSAVQETAPGPNKK